MGERVTRAWVEKERRRTGHSQQRIVEMLGEVAFPAEYHALARHLQKVGATRSAPVSEIGRGP